MGGDNCLLEFEAAQLDFEQALTHFTESVEQQRMAAENISRAAKRLKQARTMMQPRAEKLVEQPRTMTVPEAGKTYLNLSRDASYDAAKRGDIPTIRLGRTLRVPIAVMEQRLQARGK